MISLKVDLGGMNSTGCAGRARRALLAVNGVVKVITSLDDQSAEVTFDERTVTHANLLAALREAGFSPNDGDGQGGDDSSV